MPEYSSSSECAPIVSSFNDRIQPLVECMDKLRQLNILQQGIQLPSVVLIGDQSSGKSRVLESLVGISLSKGEAITELPLILKLQNHSETRIQLEYNGKSVPTDEAQVADAIVLATDEIAGHAEEIYDIPLTLIVQKNGVPNMTLVDLPGTSDPISKFVMKYITPEEIIILNVLPATDDFLTCQCIEISKKVNGAGERTLVVVTKVDDSPEGLLEKVTANDTNMRLGYVFVRNRIGNESCEEARTEEARLFETHPLLSKIDKSMVGVPVLAHKLVQLQENIISKCLPDIVRKIDEKLAFVVAFLNELPKHSSSVAEAMATFMRIRNSVNESLDKIPLNGEFDEFAMKCTSLID